MTRIRTNLEHHAQRRISWFVKDDLPLRSVALHKTFSIFLGQSDVIYIQDVPQMFGIRVSKWTITFSNGLSKYFVTKLKRICDIHVFEYIYIYIYIYI